MAGSGAFATFFVERITVLPSLVDVWVATMTCKATKAACGWRIIDGCGIQYFRLLALAGGTVSFHVFGKGILGTLASFFCVHESKYLFQGHILILIAKDVLLNVRVR